MQAKGITTALLLGLATAAPALPLPTVFESNRGQTDPQVRFLARHGGSSLFLMEDGGAVLSLGRGVDGERQTVRMSLVGGSPHPQAVGEGEHGAASYYRGNDPAKWIVGVPTWDRARYSSVYPGIDLVYYVDGGRLEHDFLVAPGADPQSILLRFDGLDQKDRPVVLDGEGRLRLATLAGELVLEAPRLYQEVDGEKRNVAGRYQPAGPGRVRFAVGEYDRSRPLVIDPVLVYSSFLGGSGNEAGESYTAADPAGNSIFVNWDFSDDFPLVAPILTTRPGSFDMVIAKVSADGSHLVYSTFFGGTGGDQPTGLAVDAAGNAYVAGLVFSVDYPVLNAVQPVLGGGGSDFFITKLSPAGTLVYSTYLGGSNFEYDFVSWSSIIAVTPGGTVYLAGGSASADYPQVHAIQGLTPGDCVYYWDPNPQQCQDAVLTVLSPSGQQILYSTFIGGSGDDWTGTLGVDSDGTAYLMGFTGSTDFPLVNPFQVTDGLFIVKIRPDGTPPVYSTRFGAGQMLPWSIAADAEKNAYIFLSTYTPGLLPVKNAIQPVHGGGGHDWYLAKINPRGTGLDYATYLGGTDFDGGWRMALDPLGNAAMVGYTLIPFDAPNGHVEPGFPLVRPLRAIQFPDALVAKVHGTGPTLLYSTPLGGSGDDRAFGVAMDARGDVYVSGLTDSADFPLAHPMQPALNGPSDNFVTRIADGIATLATPSRIAAQPGGTVTVPVRFTPGGFDIAFTAFSIDYDEACLTFDPTDANADGIPDAIAFNLPAGYGKSVQFNAGDTDGEIDVTLFDPAPPFSLLPLGEPARITFHVKPTCGGSALSTLVRVGFSSAPAVSFGDVTGHSVPGISLDGSLEVFGGQRGDCNGDQLVDAGDLGADVLELFDTDGSFWLDAPLSTFPGSPIGCDANADLAIDAGDLSCTPLLIFQGSGACATTPLIVDQPASLQLPARTGSVNGRVDLPVNLLRGTAGVNSVAFSLILPGSLEFNPADADGDGVPEAVSFKLPAGFLGSVRWTPENRAGQLALLVIDTTGRGKPLPLSSTLAVIHLTLKKAATEGGLVRFGTAPAASFGTTRGTSTPGSTRDGLVGGR
jgi:hypothetical protein